MITKVLSTLRNKLETPQDYARRAGVTFGQRCKISSRSFGSEPHLVEIGDHVHVTTGVHFVTHDGGVWVGRERDPSLDVFGKIKVGNNTYIGNHALILPGVTIGDDCVIGAYSVVTKSIPDGCVIAGNPARYICSTEDYLERMSRLNAETKALTPERKRRRLLTGDIPMIERPMMKIPNNDQG